MSGTLPKVPTKGAHWYAVALQPHADALAREHLERQGFVVFAPTLERTVRHARQFRTKIVPLFPGYLFVRLDLMQVRWRSINGTRGVRAILTVGERPVRVPEAVVAALMSEAGQRAPAGLSPGTALEVVNGPFAGLVARLEALEGKSRVAVLMELIGGAAVSVSLPMSAVRPAA